MAQLNEVKSVSEKQMGRELAKGPMEGFDPTKPLPGVNHRRIPEAGDNQFLLESEMALSGTALILPSAEAGRCFIRGQEVKVTTSLGTVKHKQGDGSRNRVAAGDRSQGDCLDLRMLELYTKGQRLFTPADIAPACPPTGKWVEETGISTSEWRGGASNEKLARLQFNRAKSHLRWYTDPKRNGAVEVEKGIFQMTLVGIQIATEKVEGK